MKKSFFYRVEPNDIMAEIIAMSLDERGAWITQLCVDLAKGCSANAVHDYSKRVIEESNSFRQKKADAANKRWGNEVQSTCDEDAVHKHSNARSSSSNSTNNKPKHRGFQPPTIDEVKTYCSERNKGVDPARWFDFYEAKGWMIGKNKMKSWKAAVRTWESSENKSAGTDHGQY